ncbi:MAG TPA: DUF115 domain-containing protein, partial [Candidatus Ozemobacteraceae bacterium]|nr:DUF115 domain-containing protein [Candidatus Ozemobacteraceae bacterium]
VEPMVHPDILESFRGPKMMMAFGGGIIPWIEKYREPFGNVICWGSIATTAFDMARQFGCDPIIFLGLDLSFADGRLYARGSYSDDVFYDKVHHLTSLEHEIADYIGVRGVHRLTGPRGDVLFTDQNMNMYRQWFEDQFRSTKAKVINATEGGVVTRHVVCQRFADAIRQYQDQGGPVRQLLSQALEAPVRLDREGLHAEMRTTLRELNEFRDVAREGIGFVASWREANPRFRLAR